MVDDILKAFMNSGDSKPENPQNDDNPLAGLVGSLLGGGGAQEGGLGDIINGFLGGGGAEAGANPMLEPIVNGLAQKIGLPPDVAQMVVTFVLNKLMSDRLGGAAPAAGFGGPESGQGLDLAGLLGGQGLDASSLRDSGISQALAEQTGLCPYTAANTLPQVLRIVVRQ